MSKRNRIIVIITAVMLLAGVSVTFAWFARHNSANIEDSGGSVVTRYFHKGDGTSENPYEITRPVHFYNLIMLYQANPAVNGSDFITASTHFRIGTKDLDLDGIDELDEYSVFEYDNDGNTTGDPSKTLNLASYTEGLFPIGSAEKPFQATLDGNNITLKNLKIVGSTSLNGNTYTTPDIGLFGYVSNKAGDTAQTPTIKNLYIDSMTIDLTNVDISPDHLSTLTKVAHDETKHNDHAAYVGYIAGHIITGAQVNDVYVNNCTITGGNEAYSGFGFFGCVEDNDGNIVKTLDQEIITKRTKGDNAGFGGSVDMKQMHKRLENIVNDSSTTKPKQYYSIENIVIDKNNDTRVVLRDGLTNVDPRDNVQYLHYTTENKYAGEYYYINDSNGRYMCLYGDSSRMPKTVNTYTISTEDLKAFYICDGDKYLKAVQSGITSSDQSGASKWSFDESGHLFTYINNETYYLNRDGRSGVTVSQTANTVWSQNEQDELYTEKDGIAYYLYYSADSAGWRLSSLKQYYYISDNAGHFLSAQPASTGALEVISANSADSSIKWQIDISGNEYTIFTDASNADYYLAIDPYGNLTMSTTEFSWVFEEDGYFTKTVSSGSLSTQYRLVYDGGWKVSEVGKLISDGNVNFLSRSTTSVINSTQENAAVWKTMVDQNGNTQFYTFINSVPYYLSYNETDKLITVNQVPYNWKKDGNSYLTSDGKYYIGFENDTWKILPCTYQIISDGNENYLKANGNNSFSNTTIEEDATHFYFSNGDSGTLAYYYNGTKYYLGNDNESFANTQTNWTKTAEGYLRSGDTDYYLVYDGDWKISDCGIYYTISYNNNYLNINSSRDGVTNGTSSTNATWWKFSNSGSNPSGTIMAKGTDDKYLTLTRNSLSVGSASKEWINTNGRLSTSGNYGSTYYITYSNSRWAANRRNGTTLTITPQKQNQPGSVLVTTKEVTPQSLTIIDNPVPAPNVSISDPFAVDCSLDFEETTQKRITKETKTGVIGGYQTYFPLRIADDKETDWYDAADPYKVSQKNTGYIISGARLEDSSATADGQKAYGDIRISYFPIRSVSSSYNSGTNTFSTIKTVNGSGIQNYTANSSVYQEASEQLLETLKGSSSVYGLHFMDAEISKDYLVTAEKAVVLGKEYDNYEMPMDSIDFNVIERGFISFFAGDYFTGNNAFFSLHQVFRDENNKITDIKEIKEIFEHKEKGAAVPYVYMFTDGKYSADVDISDYKSVFNTDWITNPGFNSEGSSIYYFEIPCNKGEYCLGSVSGKTGAYLIYLDIAANGGDVISKVISTEGNVVTNTFRTEYRTAPERLGDDNYSVLLFSTTAPQGTSQDDFSVKLSFEKLDTNDDDYSPDYANGVYTITITNKSGSAIQLDVFLCDDDRDISNDFLYAYRVVYNNLDHTGSTVQTVLNRNCWQAMASFTIPSTGDASEISYES